MFFFPTDKQLSPGPYGPSTSYSPVTKNRYSETGKFINF